MKLTELICKPKLSTMITVSLAVWASACWALHGLAILMYVGLQAIITGGFVATMNQTEANGRKARAAKLANTQTTAVEEVVSEPAPAIREESLVGAA
ncbi:MAG: hypothetical protein CMJ78_22470 [Planctomycetaceae bacterium]|nr:hypothetical protein [Planctomycetaceae bacterium]